MRDLVLSSRISLFSRVSSIALLGGLVASCSSGFQRFDTSLYESAVPQQAAQAQNPYPGGVDNRTTASVAGRLAPLVNIAPAVVPQGVYHKPEPTFVAQNPVYAPQPTYTPKAYKPYVAPQALGASRYQAASQSLSQVTQSPLPKPAYIAPAIAKPKIIQKVAAYVPPKPEVPAQAVYIPNPSADRLKTSAIRAVQPAPISQPVVQVAAAQPSTSSGWGTDNGTTIAVRQGETLYNISKRYGVPVSAIRSANNMAPSASLRAGQNILIPNYTFSRSAQVSAPDNDPQTRASRATTGYLGEASPANVAYPTLRPRQTAAVSASGDLSDSQRQRYVPKTHVSPPTKETTPDYSIVTGSVNSNSAGVYTVQAGDNLSRIARNNGTSVSALQNANGITGTNIRVGQVLRLPSGIDPVTTASVKNPATVSKQPLPANVDPIITGSLKPAVVKDKPAPARTGVSDFRWPVKGRVVSTFGENGTNGKNDGIDISVPEGTAVHAAENGVVIYAGDEIASYGNLILVRHADGWVSAYAHNRNYEVKKGDQVRRGQIIARSGRTGNAERPKLHFELRKDSAPVNPKKYLAG